MASSSRLVRGAQNFGIDTESRIWAFLFFLQLGIKFALVVALWLAMMASMILLPVLFIFDPIKQWNTFVNLASNNPFVLFVVVMISLSVLSGILAKTFGMLKVMVALASRFVRKLRQG